MIEETYSSEGPQCPYCKAQYTADEPFYYESGYTEDECDQCSKKFEVEVYIKTTWACNPIEKEKLK